MNKLQQEIGKKEMKEILLFAVISFSFCFGFLLGLIWEEIIKVW